MTDIIRMEVWIHSNAETSAPDSVDVFNIDGKVHMQWFHEVFEKNNDCELAEQFFTHLKNLDDCAWFNVKAMQEDGSGITEHYIEVVGLVE